MSENEYSEILHNARILIVDDDENVLSLLCRLFEQEGYASVETACAGREAVRRVLLAAQEEMPYDLLVLDLMLAGGMSGQEVYQELSSSVDLPIVVITARTDKASEMEALKYLDVEEYFIKPFDVELFMLKCEKVLSRQVFTRQLLVGNRRSQKLFLNVLQVMAKVLEAKDPYTRFHSENVARFARQIARRFGFTPEDLDLIGIAGILHDFGKIGITAGVLNKPGSLTAEEYKSVKRHPMIATAILEPIEELTNIIRDIRHHHERWDGTGYPDGLAEEEIPLGARILAVADAYDAMTSARSYHESKSEAEAREEFLRCSGKQFDPKVVQVLLEVIEEDGVRRKRIIDLEQRLG